MRTDNWKVRLVAGVLVLAALGFVSGRVVGQCKTFCVGTYCAVSPNTGIIYNFLTKQNVNGKDVYVQSICNWWYCATAGCDPTACQAGGTVSLWYRAASASKIDCNTGCANVGNLVPWGFIQTCTDNPNNTPQPTSCYQGCVPKTS